MKHKKAHVAVLEWQPPPYGTFFCQVCKKSIGSLATAAYAHRKNHHPGMRTKLVGDPEAKRKEEPMGNAASCKRYREKRRRLIAEGINGPLELPLTAPQGINSSLRLQAPLGTIGPLQAPLQPPLPGFNGPCHAPSMPPTPTSSCRSTSLILVDQEAGKGLSRTVVVTRTSGTGRRIYTGRLAKLFKESADVAISLVGTRAEELARCLGCLPVIQGGTLEQSDWDVHVSLPGVGIKKDGTSGGLGIAVSLVALLFGKDFVDNIAFTGEIDLWGNVLPIGDLEKKLEGARQIGFRSIVIPQASYDSLDLASLTAELRGFISTNVFPVSTLLEAVSHSLAGNFILMYFCDRLDGWFMTPAID